GQLGGTGGWPRSMADEDGENCWWGAQRQSSSGSGTPGRWASRRSWCATSPVTTSRCCAPSRSSDSTSCPPFGLYEACRVSLWCDKSRGQQALNPTTSLDVVTWIAPLAV